MAREGIAVCGKLLYEFGLIGTCLAGIIAGKSGKLVDYTPRHLLGGLVGEGDGKNLPVCLRLAIAVRLQRTQAVTAFALAGSNLFAEQEL